ncbi:MAG: hypothetical protein ACI4A7_04840 [Prevotella sp.]
MKKCIFTLFAALCSMMGMAQTFNEVVVYDGPDYTVDWSSWLTLSGAKFADAQVGDKLVFYVKDAGENPQIQINGSDWTSITANDQEDVTGDDLTVELATEAMAEKVKGGLYIKGQNVTITKISLMQQKEVAVYGDPVSVYSGDPVVLGNWKGECTVASDKFIDAKVGDKLLITFTDVESGAQIQIADGDYNAIVEYDDIVGTTYEFIITDEALASFQETGLVLKGQKATITDVAICSLGGSTGGGGELNEIVIYDGDPVTLSGYSNYFNLPGSKFASALVGDKVKFYISDLGTTPQLAFQDYDTWTSILSVNQVDVSGDSYLLKIADEDILEALKKGIHVKGQDVTVTKVTLLTQAAPVDYNKTTIYEGEVALGNWSNWVEVAAAGFANANIGDKVVINFKDVESGAQVQLNTMIEGWNQFIPYDDVSGTSYEYVFNDKDVLSELKEYGMAIKGQKCTVTSVDLYTNTATEISGIATKGNNTEKVVYNLKGERMNASSLNGAHGVFIVRENGKTYKIAK